MTDDVDQMALEALLRDTVWVDALQRQLDRVNVLEVFRITRYELAHSAFWAWLLDPKATHRMGDRFLRAFLRLCSTHRPGSTTYSPPWHTPNLIDFERADLERAEVSVERQPKWNEGLGDNADLIAKNRFDVMLRLPLRDNAEAMVVVEFKIEAKEGKDQTERYTQALLAMIADEALSYTSALAVFIDVNDNPPSSDAFLPLTLNHVVRAVILPILETGSDILLTDVSSILRQYCQAVQEESGGVDDRTKEFIKEHARALGLMRRFLHWRPSLLDLVQNGDVPDGSEVVFKDTKTSASINAVVCVRSNKAVIVISDAISGKERTFFSLSSASAGMGRRTSYNGWVHWYYQGRQLDEYRSCMSREKSLLDKICSAIVSGRRSAVKRLIDLAVAEEYLPESLAPAPKGTKGFSLLSDLVSRGYLHESQTLYFRKKEEKNCEVTVREGNCFLRVGGRYFETPSGASAALNDGQASSGFADLFLLSASGSFRSMGEVRAEYQDAVRAIVDSSE